MKAVICAIAKNENKYINNWCNYHITLGFDHIYLFDNNDSSTPFVGNFIDEALKDKVTIFNVNDIHKGGFQNECYTKFYAENKDTFDWCAFIDIDEFINLKNYNNINDFLVQNIFNGFDAIRLRWHLFGDDDVIERDESIPVQQFFKKHLQQHSLDKQCKSIIRGGLPKVIVTSSHYGTFDGKNLLKQCRPDGSETNCKIIEHDRLNQVAWINHYMTKTLKEFLEQKFNRTDCQFKDRQLTTDYFWKINKKTYEKEKYIEKFIQDLHSEE